MTTTQTTKTRSIPTTSVTAVAMILSDLGSEITDQYPTEGACGYTTLVYTTNSLPEEPRCTRDISGYCPNHGYNTCH